MPLVGEAVEDGDAGPLRELVGDVLAEAAVLDRVVHAAEHAGGVLDRLLVAHVRAARADEGDVGALVVGRDLERATRAGRVLLEDQRDLLADELLLLAALLLRRLQLGGEVDEVADLVGGVVGQLEEVPAVQVDDGAHSFSFQASRAIGQVMQWPPPRPRPSSWPAIACTSTPAFSSLKFVASLRSYATITPGARATTLLPSSHWFRSASNSSPPVVTTVSVCEAERVLHLLEERALRELGAHAPLAVRPVEDRQDLRDDRLVDRHDVAVAEGEDRVEVHRGPLARHLAPITSRAAPAANRLCAAWRCPCPERRAALARGSAVDPRCACRGFVDNIRDAGLECVTMHEPLPAER